MDNLQRYVTKCVDLRKRLRETEEHNDVMVAKIQATKRMIQRARLERALLLTTLETQTSGAVAQDADSPPASPLLNEVVQERKERKDETRKRLKPRDPRLPKRPQNAYIIFCEAEKERIRKDQEAGKPDLPADLTKALPIAWKQLGPDGRRPYYQAYKDDRLRYMKAMVAFPSAGLSPTDQKEKQRAVKYMRELEEQPDKKDLLDEDERMDDVDGGDVTEEEDLKPMRSDSDGEDGDDEDEDDVKSELASEPPAASAPASELISEAASEAPSEAPSEDIKVEPSVEPAEPAPSAPSAPSAAQTTASAPQQTASHTEPQSTAPSASQPSQPSQPKPDI